MLQWQLLCDCWLFWPRCFQQINSADWPSHSPTVCEPGVWAAAGPAHALQEGHLSSLWKGCNSRGTAVGIQEDRGRAVAQESGRHAQDSTLIWCHSLWDKRGLSFPASSFGQPAILPVDFLSSVDHFRPSGEGTSAISWVWTVAALFSIQEHQAVLGSLLPESINKRI